MTCFRHSIIQRVSRLSRHAGIAIMTAALLAPALAPQTAGAAAPPAVVVFESSVGAVHFPHTAHLKFGCAVCHHQIQADELDTPHPDYLESSWIHCETCHDAAAADGGQYYKCSKCHRAKPAHIADETLSAKVVVHKSCWKCHASGTGVEASAGCGECHAKGN